MLHEGMAKKTKKFKASKRRAVAATRPGPAGPPSLPLPASAAPDPKRRSEARVGFPEGAAVPLDRVPYFTSDLKRIATTVLIMIAIIAAGSLVLPNLQGSLFR